MMPALWMPVELTWSTLNCGTYFQSKTKDAVLQGMELACKKNQENFIRDRGSVHCGHGLQCLIP